VSRINKPIVGDDGELLVAHPVPPLPTTPEWVPEPSEPPPAPPSPPAAPQRRWIELSVWQLGVMILLIGVVALVWELQASQSDLQVPPKPFATTANELEYTAMQILERPVLQPDGTACKNDVLDQPGTAIVFTTEPRSGVANLHLLTHNATQICTIYPYTWVESPRWSPDGSAIVFTASADMGHGIFIFSGNPALRQRLTNDPREIKSPAWSPDGRTVAFLAREASSDEWAIDTVPAVADDPSLDSGERNLYISISTGVHDLAWSPDGERFVYSAHMNVGYVELFLASANSGWRRQVTNAEGVNWEADWSPDSQWIVWAGNRMSMLSAINADAASGGTSSPTYLVYDPNQNFWVSSPVWLPDGNAVAFILNTNAGEGIVLKPLFGDVQVITGVIPDIVSFDWR
jgi:hypothetical protein